MAKTDPNSKYDSAYLDLYREVIEALIAEDPILGDFSRVVSRHVGPRRNVRGPTPLDQTSGVGEAISTLMTTDIISTNVEAHDVMLFETGKQMIAAQTQFFFRGIGEMSEAAGTTVANIGEGTPTIEQLRDLFTKIDLDFEEDGSLSKGLRMYVDPRVADKAAELMAIAKADPEINAIIDRKRAEWVAKRAAKRDRRLS